MSRVRVDPIRCDAFGMCSELLPERITLDDWGYPIIDGRPLTGRLLELANDAVAACPRAALWLADDDPASRR
ncbi:MAG: ferredoxin [Candidatus Dormibacteraeota bacterium]|nr:ferredoxin [Candidatus Dormibacteraeota bacterium]